MRIKTEPNCQSQRRNCQKPPSSSFLLVGQTRNDLSLHRANLQSKHYENEPETYANQTKLLIGKRIKPRPPSSAPAVFMGLYKDRITPPPSKRQVNTLNTPTAIGRIRTNMPVITRAANTIFETEGASPLCLRIGSHNGRRNTGALTASVPMRKLSN